MPPIFHGLGALFDTALGLNNENNGAYGGRPNTPRYKSRQAAIDLSDNGGPIGNGEPQWPALIHDAMAILTHNINANNANPAPSAANWRWVKKLHLANQNQSAEKTLEKMTAFLLDENWVNQVPICNGLVEGGRADAARVDLAHLIEDDSYELIELKFRTDAAGGSNHPLSAVIEIVQYGLVYLLFRQHNFPETRHHPLLQAKRIKLVVLAPEHWYTFRQRRNANTYRFHLNWLTNAFSAGLQQHATQSGLDLSVAVEYRVLDPAFHANYLALLGNVQVFRDRAHALSAPLVEPNNPHM